MSCLAYCVDGRKLVGAEVLEKSTVWRVPGYMFHFCAAPNNLYLPEIRMNFVIFFSG